MSSAADLLPFALIVFGGFCLWRARRLAPPLLRAAATWLRRACCAAPRLLRNVFVGREQPPRPRHAWQRPRRRITWVARTALYPTLVAAVIWQWDGRTGVGIYATDLEVEASAPRQVPANEPLPLRVVATPLGGGTVEAEVRWRALDEHGELLAAGDAPCIGTSTLRLPEAQRVRSVEIVARGPKGEQSLRLDRTTSATTGGGGAVDRARTRSAERAHALVKTAERRQHVVWMLARLGLVLVGLWLVAETGAWLARRALRAASTLPRQLVGAALIVLPTALWASDLSDWDRLRSAWKRHSPSPFEEFLLIARSGIDADVPGVFSWSWWLPLEVDPRR